MFSLLKRIPYKVHRAIVLCLQLVIAVRQYQQLKSQAIPRFVLAWKGRWLHLSDATATTGFDRHYVFLTA